MPSIQPVTLDVTKVVSGTQWVRMGQSDSGGTTIRASIFDNGTALSLTGASAVFCMRLPGGMYYVRDDTCTVSGNTITYLVNEDYCCTVSGQTDVAYFEIHTGGRILSTSRFKVEVKRAAASGAAVHSFDNDIQEQVAQFLDRVEGRIEDILAEMVSDYVLPVATTNSLGGVKPDGTTISVDDDGTIHSLLDGEDYAMSEQEVETLTPLDDLADLDREKF